MASQFTDPGWWQQRPRQPQEISTMKMIVGTLVPAIVIVAVVAVIITSREQGSSKGQGERSVAAFQVCLSAHGITATTKSGSPAQQQALTDCRENLPSGTHISNFSAGANAQQQLGECMQDAGSGRPRGSGRFGGGRGGPSDSYLNALTICRSLVQSGEAPPPTAPAQTSTTPPIA
jgi:hypothetical protein